MSVDGLLDLKAWLTIRRDTEGEPWGPTMLACVLRRMRRCEVYKRTVVLS